MSAEKFSQIESKITKSVVYNTASLTAKYLATKLQPGDKVLTFGNEGLNEEICSVGLNA